MTTYDEVSLKEGIKFATYHFLASLPLPIKEEFFNKTVEYLFNEYNARKGYFSDYIY